MIHHATKHRNPEFGNIEIRHADVRMAAARPCGLLRMLCLLVLVLALQGCGTERKAPPEGGETRVDAKAAGLESGTSPAGAESTKPGAASETEGAEAVVSDLDRSAEDLLSAQCEHEVPQYTCDECRYQVGMVMVPRDLFAPQGPLDTLVVTPRSFSSSRSFPGEVRLNEERAAYVDPKISGTVRSISVDLGARVRRGQILYQVESPDFSETKAQALRARTALNLAQATLDRESDLYNKKVCPKKDLLEATAARDEAAATEQATRMRLLHLGLTAADLEKIQEASPSADGNLLNVLAPFDGTVLERNLSLGSAVEPGQKLLLMADISRLWVVISLPEAELAAFPEPLSQAEIPAEVTVASYPDRVFEGRLDRLSGLLEEATRTAKARVLVENRDGRLRSGMFAQVRLGRAGDRTVLAVPSDAVLEDAGRSFVFLAQKPPYYLRRPVVLGRSVDGWTEVLAGLRGGETLVSRGAFLLKSDVLRSKMGAGCAD